MKTSFQLVSEMNVAFGNPKGDPLNVNWMRIAKQYLNVSDELAELFVGLGADEEAAKKASAEFKAALKASLTTLNPDLEKVRDASRDIVVFADGGHHLMGLDGDLDMQSVIDGVMTRFIKNDVDKIATITKHAAKGVTEVYFEGEYPTMIMKSLVDQPDAPKGKFLKSASYTEPVFYSVEPVVQGEVKRGTLTSPMNEEAKRILEPVRQLGAFDPLPFKEQAE